MCADGLRSIRQREPGRPLGSVLPAFEPDAQGDMVLDLKRLSEIAPAQLALTGPQQRADDSG